MKSGYMKAGRMVTLLPQRKVNIKRFPRRRAPASSPISDAELRDEAISLYQSVVRFQTRLYGNDKGDDTLTAHSVACNSRRDSMAEGKRRARRADETIAATIARRRNAARAVLISQTLSIWLLQVTRSRALSIRADQHRRKRSDHFRHRVLPSDYRLRHTRRDVLVFFKHDFQLDELSQSSTRSRWIRVTPTR
jgi:hypothetical protein